jgi:ankyrin repeat protein
VGVVRGFPCALLVWLLLAGCTAGGEVASQPTDAPSGSPAARPGPPSPSAAVTPPEGSAAGLPSPAVREPSLDLPLIEAAARGDLPEVRRLLERGASVRASDQRGRTALIAAAYGNHVRVARVLLEAGADPNEKDATVQSAYLIATSEVGDEPRLLELLLAAGAEVDSRDSFNGTGLIRAAERGFPEIVELLLESGVEVDHVNRLGWTALHEAIILGGRSPRYVQVVRRLVAAGADVNLPSARDRVRPLTHARSRGQTQVAQVLEAAGAKP